MCVIAVLYRLRFDFCLVPACEWYCFGSRCNCEMDEKCSKVILPAPFSSYKLQAESLGLDGIELTRYVQDRVRGLTE